MKDTFAKKGWTMFDLEIKEILVSSDVIFFEHVFPMSELNSQNSTPISDLVSTQEFYADDYDEFIMQNEPEHLNDQPVTTEKHVVQVEGGQIRKRWVENMITTRKQLLGRPWSLG